VKQLFRGDFIHRGKGAQQLFLQRNITTNDNFARFSDF